MELDIDPAIPVPLYLQIVEKLRRFMALGALRPGDRLPTIRELAVRARVNRNTAARAIQQLEADGLVRTQVGLGTFVTENGVRLDQGARNAAIDQSLERVLIEAHGLGVPLDELPPRLARKIETFRDGDDT